jgi:tetratricopeptide (TPR) repeat protein
MAECREALRLDPIGFGIHFSYTWACLNTRQWEEGAIAFENFLELYPESALAHGNYAMLLQALGRYEEALEHAEISRRIAGIDPTADWSIGSILACLGREADARAIAEKSARRWEQDKRSWRTATASDAIGLIIMYTCLGDTERALYWLEEVVESGTGGGLNWQLFLYDPLRELPEAIELARRANIPPSVSSGVNEWTLSRIEPAWTPPAIVARK